MPGPILSTLYISPHSNPISTRTISLPLNREGNRGTEALGHIARKQTSWNMNRGSLAPSSLPFSHTAIVIPERIERYVYNIPNRNNHQVSPISAVKHLKFLFKYEAISPQLYGPLYQYHQHHKATGVLGCSIKTGVFVCCIYTY